MPVVRAADAVVHEMYGSRFASYAAPARGSAELCAWRLEVPAGSTGVPHAVSREEVLLVLDGTLRVTLGAGTGPGEGGPETGRPAEAGPAEAGPGDVVLVPAGSRLALDNPGPAPAIAWVTTSGCLEARLADGTAVSPPWVR